MECGWSMSAGDKRHPFSQVVAFPFTNSHTDPEQGPSLPIDPPACNLETPPPEAGQCILLGSRPGSPQAVLGCGRQRSF